MRELLIGGLANALALAILLLVFGGVFCAVIHLTRNRDFDAHRKQ